MVQRIICSSGKKPTEFAKIVAPAKNREQVGEIWHRERVKAVLGLAALPAANGRFVEQEMSA
jgi:hypothetical protein